MPLVFIVFIVFLLSERDSLRIIQIIQLLFSHRVGNIEYLCGGFSVLIARARQ